MARALLLDAPRALQLRDERAPDLTPRGIRVKALVSGKPITTFAAWKKKGYDANSVNANPLLSGPLGGGPGSYHLRAGSPAVDLGRAVTAGVRPMSTEDYDGTTIPQGANYDAGAYEQVAR